jgi:hypothetical protein
MSEQTFDQDLPDDPPAIRIGDVLGRSLRLCSWPFAIYVALTAVLILPADLIARALTDHLEAETAVLSATQTIWLAQISTGLEALIFGPTAQALVQAWLFQQLRGGTADVRHSLRQVARRWPALIATAFCYYLFVTIGWVALAFPGVIIAVRTMVAAPACLLEGLPPMAALRRSQTLTRGHRWKIFGLYLLCTVPLVLAEGTASVVAEQFASADIANLVDLLARAVMSAFFAVLTLVLYHTLRVAHDGPGADQVAAVFD